VVAALIYPATHMGKVAYAVSRVMSYYRWDTLVTCWPPGYVHCDCKE